jgi:hypothetical protein
MAKKQINLHDEQGKFTTERGALKVLLDRTKAMTKDVGKQTEELIDSTTINTAHMIDLKMTLEKFIGSNRQFFSEFLIERKLTSDTMLDISDTLKNLTLLNEQQVENQEEEKEEKEDEKKDEPSKAKQEEQRREGVALQRRQIKAAETTNKNFLNLFNVLGGLAGGTLGAVGSLAFGGEVGLTSAVGILGGGFIGEQLRKLPKGKLGIIGLGLASLGLLAADAIDAQQLADDLGIGKVTAGLSGTLGGEMEGGIKNAFSKAGQLAVIGVGVGSFAGPVGMIAGGVIGAALGGALGLLGAEKVAKIFSGLDLSYFGDFIEKVKMGFGNILDGLTVIFTDPKSGIQSILEGVFGIIGGIKDVIVDGFNSALDVATEIWKEILFEDTIPNALDSISNWFVELFEGMIEFGETSEFIKNFWGGIGDMLDAILNFIADKMPFGLGESFRPEDPNTRKPTVGTEDQKLKRVANSISIVKDIMSDGVISENEETDLQGALRNISADATPFQRAEFTRQLGAPIDSFMDAVSTPPPQRGAAIDTARREAVRNHLTLPGDGPYNNANFFQTNNSQSVKNETVSQPIPIQVDPMLHGSPSGGNR